MAARRGPSIEMLEQALRDRLNTITGFGTPEVQARKLEQFFAKVDTNGSGALDREEFAKAMAGLNFVDVDVSPLFEKYDTDRHDSIEYSEFCSAFCGLTVHPADMDPAARSVLAQLRAACARRGGLNGIRSIGRLFRIIDNSGEGFLTPDELKFGFIDFGVDMNSDKLDMAVREFDRSGDGKISYDEFLRGLRGPMSKRRRDLVLMAYDVLDKDGSGQVTIEDIASAYDTSKHPEVIAGRMTRDQVLREFLGQWDTLKRDGIVTRDEFLEYYLDVSASIDTDDYFELMIRNAWHISGGEGQYENTSNLRVLVEFLDGSQQVIEIKNDIGLVKTDMTAIRLRLHKQGIDIRQIKKISTSG
eukprot:a508851_1298.p1 GENE.a508851_1298~~a508851_1298.p1  ORF type:complete len:367 (+),score=160.21 a508851_1298:26-1102(+)